MAEKEKPDTPKVQSKPLKDKANPAGNKDPFTTPRMETFQGSQDRPRGPRRQSPGNRSK
jgi:hypothetical protein